MPSVKSLAGIPIIADEPSCDIPPTGGDGNPSIPTGISVAASVANLLPTANAGLTPLKGVYASDGLVPVPVKLAMRIRRGEFIDMGELRHEFWLYTWDDDVQKPDT